MIDHLVYASPGLERGIQEIARLTGVTATFGGQHPGRGTRNALLSLGTGIYLEIVAVDPDQPAPSDGRWLGADLVRAPRLTTWAAKGRDLTALRTRAAEQRVPLGDVRSGSRQRADGAMLRWQLTDPEPLVADGVVPFFIDWGDSPHPSATAAQGASLVEFRIEHPDLARVERMLRLLELDVPVTRAERPGLVAIIQGTHGRVELR